MAIEKLLNYSGLEKYNDLIHGELDDKSNIDGYYESMTVGNAEQLVSTVFEEDQTPYNFRTSGGSTDIGDREYLDAVVGGTIAWNQQIQNGDFSNGTYKWSLQGNTATVENGVCTVTASNKTTGIFQAVNMIADHKYLTTFEYKMSDASQRLNYWMNKGGTSGSLTPSTNWARFARVFRQTMTEQATCNWVYDNAESDWQPFYVRNEMIIDLTQMFGSQIADYIYALEQATAGAGVAFFRKLFPKPYYEYNAGELMSVKAVSHDLVGFNCWDEETEEGYVDSTTGEIVPSVNHICAKNLIPCLPNTVYYLLCPNASMAFDYYDASGAIISNRYNARGSQFTTPSNCYYMRWWNSKVNYGSQTYQHDICINLSWDGERDGEYEPYVKRSYALDSDLELRGIPKLDASNNLYYDGDTYSADGSVDRRYREVDLSSFSWSTRYTGSTNKTLSVDMTGYAYKTVNGVPNMMGAPYSRIESVGGVAALNDPDNKSVGIYSYTQSMSGTAAYSTIYIVLPKNDSPSGKLVYELATPTTETAQAYTNPQIVDDFGTEEFVDAGSRDVAIPVGHITRYAPNLRAKLEMSPNSPDGDGDYIVRQTNGENEYVSLASNATIQDIIARIEALEGSGE